MRSNFFALTPILFSKFLINCLLLKQDWPASQSMETWLSCWRSQLDAISIGVKSMLIFFNFIVRKLSMQVIILSRSSSCFNLSQSIATSLPYILSASKKLFVSSVIQNLNNWYTVLGCNITLIARKLLPACLFTGTVYIPFITHDG